MIERPTIYLSNYSSRRSEGYHGPGPMLSAQARPLALMMGEGWCPAAAPLYEHWRQVREDGDEVAYRVALEAKLCVPEVRAHMVPGLLGYYPWTWRPHAARESVVARQHVDTTRRQLVPDGSTLVCSCPRPGSRGRQRGCHLEVVAPALVAAGHDVVLHGVRLTVDGVDELGEPRVVWGEGPHRGLSYTPEQLGWPRLPDEVLEQARESA